MKCYKYGNCAYVYGLKQDVVDFVELKEESHKGRLGGVYLIGKEPEVVKIGMTANIKSRFDGLSRAFFPYPITLLYFKDGIMDAGKAEVALQKLFKSKRISGEWFRLTRPEILKAIRFLEIIES